DRLRLAVAGRQLQHGDAGVLGLRRDPHDPLPFSIFDFRYSIASCNAANRPAVTASIENRKSKIENVLNATAALVLDDVQPALLPGRAGPAPRPLVLAVAARPRARPAADARVTAVVQRVVGHAVLGDERPHVQLGPAQERVDLHQPELGVPLYHARLGPVLGLVAADGADPGGVA